MALRNWLIGGGIAVAAVAGGWLSRSLEVFRDAPPESHPVSDDRSKAAAAMFAASPTSTTLAAAGVQDLHLEVIEYVGGPTLQDWTDAAGKRRSLTSIFTDEHVNINVIVNRPPPRANNFMHVKSLDDAHLDALLRSAPPTVSGGWHVTAFMLPVAHASGNLGGMSDPSRRRFAVFGPAHVGPDQVRLLLRTTAHELGHALNLFHNDGDADPTCCSQGRPLNGLSIMNQLRCVQPGATSFRFSDAEKRHLLDHDIDAVRPGSAIQWNDCPRVHRHFKQC